MKRIAIFGRTSAIAEATARRYARHGSEIFLVARNAQKLAAVAADLRLRGATKVIERVQDLDETRAHEALVTEAETGLNGIDLALIAYGTLGNNEAGAQDFNLAEKVLHTNFVSPASLLTALAQVMTRQNKGVIAVIGSVAGDRGRQSNYVYGSAKGALALFAAGLRNRLVGRGVHVLTIKPGFVDTPMTAQFKKGPLWASPDRIARGIEHAVKRRRDVVYLPRFWWLILFLIRAIPERVFKRLKL